jgi:Fe2+ transport system protein B
MSSPEDIERKVQTFREVMSVTEALNEASYKTDALTLSVQSTEELEALSDQQHLLDGRRQYNVSQTGTDMLPAVSPGVMNLRRQVRLLREENKRLRSELSAKQSELQQVIADYDALEARFNQEVSVIHTGHQQDVEHYQVHLQELMEERNRLQETCTQLEQNYQELYHSFQDVVEEEINKRLTEVTYALQTSPETVPPVLQGVVRTLEAHYRPAEEKHLVEALFLKREVESMAEQLQEERKQLAEERQKLLAMQQTAREQAMLRQQTLKARLHARWKVSALVTAVSLLAMLVVLQCVFLYILHVSFVAPISVSLFAPIVLCAMLSLVFSHPITMLKYIYTSAPHKKRVKKNA